MPSSSDEAEYINNILDKSTQQKQSKVPINDDCKDKSKDPKKTNLRGNLQSLNKWPLIPHGNYVN